MNQEATRSIELSTESLFELIESKLHLLSEMQAMSLAQTDLVSQHDMTALMTLLSRKQELMGALGSVQTQLAQFQGQDPEQRKWSSPGRRKTCQEMVARCDQLLQELIVMEDRSLGNMNLQRETACSLFPYAPAADARGGQSSARLVTRSSAVSRTRRCAHWCRG